MTVHLGRQGGSTSVRALTTALALRRERSKTSPDLSYNAVFIPHPVSLIASKLIVGEVDKIRP